MKTLIAGFALICSATALNAAELSDRMAPGKGDWGGFYAGGTLGYAFLSDHNGLISDYGQGGIYGVFGGFNAQLTDNFVIGLEADYTRYNIAFEKVPAIKAVDGSSVRARAGFVIGDALIYGAAGIAYGTTNINLEDFGSIVGVGAEYKITDNVIFGVEYSHNWFKNFDNAGIDVNIDMVRARLSFKIP